MLAGFFLEIVHDRRLLREAQVNLAIRWFIGFGLHKALPDHSSLTRIWTCPSLVESVLVMRRPDVQTGRG
jgi:hypothetical protein